MNLFAIAGLSVGIFCTLLASIALIFGRNKLNRLLLFFNVACAVWGFGLFLVGIADTETWAVFVWQIGRLGGIFVAPVSYHIVSVLTETKNRTLIICGYSQAIVLN